MNPNIRISNSSGTLEIRFSGNSFFASPENEVPLGAIAFDERLIAVLGYNPMNVEAVVDGVVVDWEYYVGKKKQRIDFIVRAHRKAALSMRDLQRKLRVHAGCVFHAHGTRHAKWKNRDGRVFTIPRHARDIGPGLLREILRQAGMSISISEFLSLE